MRRHDVAFSPYSEDAEDYYNYVPSDDSDSDTEDALEPSNAVKPADPVEELAATFASSSSINSSVLTPIGGFAPRHDKRREAQASSPGVCSQGNGQELRMSPRALEQHEERRNRLQAALDGVGSGGLNSGEAPFRFTSQRALESSDEEMKDSGASPAPTEQVEGHGPEKKSLGRMRSTSSDSEHGAMEPDPLYDEQLDDADEKWVDTNLRGERSTKPETEATLCCPCCFVTVCLTCERHATYTNQYRASAAINCRVKKDEILTYTTTEAGMPFQKRRSLSAKTATTSQQIARLLQTNEYHSVVCSDCGTMVGVFDHHQRYHFFNVLPSNC